MKVLVIGGTGAFGARLCGLLARDGVEVCVASRSGPDGLIPSQRPEAFAPADATFTYMAFDRAGPLDGFGAFDVIVDAAGPFHAYGDDPYRIARAAIRAKAHYFDLSDNAGFCQGIRALDGDAKAAGVAVYSGMSSVPAISSAVVTSLADGARLLSIETAILPGNKAPRGRAVVDSILHQVGTTFRAKEYGVEVTRRSWSKPKTYDLGAGVHRQGWHIEVPDQRLFPAHFTCPTVIFRAGLELGVMRYGLGALSLARRIFGFGVRDWFVSLVMVAASWLAPFGTDTGGMSVEVVTAGQGRFSRRQWRLRARQGDGPFVPLIAVRAACRDLDALPAGAGPALSLIPLARIEAAFDDLAIETEVNRHDEVPLFRSALGEGFDALPQAVRDSHDAHGPRRFVGRASVSRGSGALAWIAALVFGFPPTDADTEVEVIKRHSGPDEIWQRRFGRHRFTSYLTRTPRGISERFGPQAFDLDFQAGPDGLRYLVAGGRAFGLLAIPRLLLPVSEAVETRQDGTFRFDVHLKAPTGATLVHYTGWLAPVDTDASRCI